MMAGQKVEKTLTINFQSYVRPDLGKETIITLEIENTFRFHLSMILLMKTIKYNSHTLCLIHTQGCITFLSKFIKIISMLYLRHKINSLRNLSCASLLVA